MKYQMEGTKFNGIPFTIRMEEEQERLEPSEEFNKPIVMTDGFSRKIGVEAIGITMMLINKRILEEGAYYMQFFYYKDRVGEIKYYVIDDGIFVTFLLPDEY